MQVIDRITVRAATLAARFSMASPIYRTDDVQFPLAVTGVRDLGGGMRRITLAGSGLRSFERVGSDEYFGLLMPPPSGELELPDPSEANVRTAIAAMPEERRPGLRWYTIRSHRPGEEELDVDIVTHGDSGPGSAWAVRARPGMGVGFRSGGALYRGAGCTGPQLLVADETAVPALAAILDDADPATDDLRVHVEVADRAVLAAYDFGRRVTVHVRGEGPPGSVVAEAVAGRDQHDLDYAWLCGEASLVAGLRRQLVRRDRVDRRSVLFSGYWRLGAERG